MSGAVGKRVTRGRIANIVALDPAGPLFTIDRPEERLHFTDADYVEVQFTDIGRLGFSQPIGHANFYPNYGKLNRYYPICGWMITAFAYSISTQPFFICLTIF